MVKSVTFDLPGVLEGARRIVPLALGVFAYGLVFGVLAHQARLSLLESLLMSGLVFAGTAQFVALSLWIAPLPLGAIILTTLVINLRSLLMGAAIRPWLAKLGPLKTYTSVFFLADENWALTMTAYANGSTNGAMLLGSGLVLYLSWVCATLVGQTAGGIIRDPARWGLDFAFSAAFLALLVGMWKGKRDIAPWLVAAVAAIVAAHWLPGKWYILIGGLAGSVTGAVQHAR